MLHISPCTTTISREHVNGNHKSEFVPFLHAYIHNLYIHRQHIDKLDARLDGLVNTLATARPTSIPAPAPFQHAGPQPGLRLLEDPALCHREDFPDVVWTRSEWNKIEERRKNEGLPSKKLGFLTDEAGAPVSRDRLLEMTKTANRGWNDLHHVRHDPSSWNKRSNQAGQYFSSFMRSKFEEFRWCERDWKIEAFATIKYPDWNRGSRSSGGLSRLFCYVLSDESLNFFIFLRCAAINSGSGQSQA